MESETDSSNWPFNSDTYQPDLENGIEIKKCLSRFEDSLLADQTSVSMVESKRTGGGHAEERDLDLEGLESWLKTKSKVHEGNHFINRFLVRDNKTPLPQGSNKLRISKEAFKKLIHHFQICPSFVLAVSQHYLPSGQCSAFLSPPYHATFSEIWYLLPVRVQVKCTDQRRAHAKSPTGSNQMNPFHYLHLEDPGVDIRGSRIAIFFRYCQTRKYSMMVAVNFMDGRWSKPVEEPKRRIKESLQSPQLRTEEDHFFPHAIYISSVLRWWMNALTSVHDQLIAYEVHLQGNVDIHGGLENNYGGINRALHSIAAHLHRYSSELEALSDVITGISNHYRTLHGQWEKGKNSEPMFMRTSQNFAQLESEAKQAKSFVQELEKKLRNILALLFNRIQIVNDRSMVSNGEKMHAILLATQEDAKTSREIALRSHEIAEEMKQDSVAMKTIAVTTMAFLPGTSIAAILSMPFFSSNAYLTDAKRIWVWFVCTIPATAIAFAIYAYWTWRNERRKRRNSVVTATADKGTAGKGRDWNR